MDEKQYGKEDAILQEDTNQQIKRWDHREAIVSRLNTKRGIEESRKKITWFNVHGS